MPASEFVSMASSPSVLGDPTLRTQHFIGGTRWHKVSSTEIVGYHQLRVPHQKYTDSSLTEVKVKGHAHSTNCHWYRKVEIEGDGGNEGGVWKFAGLAPDIRWSEYEFEKVFEEGRGELGEEEKKEEEEIAAKIVGGADGVPMSVSSTGVNGEGSEAKATDAIDAKEEEATATGREALVADAAEPKKPEMGVNMDEKAGDGIEGVQMAEIDAANGGPGLDEKNMKVGPADMVQPAGMVSGIGA